MSALQVSLWFGLLTEFPANVRPFEHKRVVQLYQIGTGTEPVQIVLARTHAAIGQQSCISFEMMLAGLNGPAGALLKFRVPPLAVMGIGDGFAEVEADQDAIDFLAGEVGNEVVNLFTGITGQ